MPMNNNNKKNNKYSYNKPTPGLEPGPLAFANAQPLSFVGMALV